MIWVSREEIAYMHADIPDDSILRRSDERFWSDVGGWWRPLSVCLREFVGKRAGWIRYVDPAICLRRVVCNSMCDAMSDCDSRVLSVDDFRSVPIPTRGHY